MRFFFAFLFSLSLAAASAAQQTPRVFVVSNTNDDGGGSLRAVIDEVNALCGVATRQCNIEFHIPGPEAWKSIRVQRPLPPILALRVFIDGSSQTRFAGDTNPAGPEIELNGSALTEGSGLDFSATCGGLVGGLAINGFPANGITLGGMHCPSVDGQVFQNYIGTDPTGTQAVPNTRGIWVTTPQRLYFHWTISDNVVSGNRNSGIFVASGPQRITRNIIGLTPRRDAALGNGASGVAVMAAAAGTDVIDNYIGFNHHFGIGLETGTKKVSMMGNSFQGNWQLAIDRGFDGVSPAAEVSIPEITSIRFENGSTIIEGHSPERLGTFPRMNFYASDAPDPSGYGEGQYSLGEARLSSSNELDFTFVWIGDLRGKWITATATRVDYYGWLRHGGVSTDSEWQGFVTATSEFSRAVEAK